MIRCPYCQAALKEATPSCPQCGMDGEKLAKIMGPLPIMFGWITQDRDLLRKREVNRLRKVVAQYQRRFPQSRLNLVLRSFPQQMDLSVILFWIFNQAGLSDQGSKGGRNHDVVILIEPSRGEAGLIVGYGLEPILSQESMDEVVERARHFLIAGDYADAIESMVDTLSGYLRAISHGLPEAVGLQEKLEDDDSDQF